MSRVVSVFPKQGHGVAKVPRTYRNLAAALMVTKRIPEGNTLITVLGVGNEYSNQRAIESWLMSEYSESAIRKMCSPLEKLGDALVLCLYERLNSEESLL
ncbi:MAG: hypothetical protein AB2598_19315 [Candidatus Thiodiazotropha sp.]